MDKTNNTQAVDGGALKAVLDILCDQSIPHLAVRMNDACKYIDAALSASTEAALPTNEELERLWDQHSGHPADFGAAVLEKWGNWPAGMLGQGGTLASTEAAAGEPIHQWRTHFGDEVWQDVPAEQFEGIGPSFRRIVYAVPPSARNNRLTDEHVTLRKIQALLREGDPKWSIRGEFGVKLHEQILDSIRYLLVLPGLYKSVCQAYDHACEDIYGARKWAELYEAINEVVAVVGCHGEICSKDDRFHRLTRALDDIDGGQYRGPNISEHEKLLCSQCPSGDPCRDEPDCERKRNQSLLSALHRSSEKTGWYADFSQAHPVSVQDQLPEHEGTIFESYEFSNGIARIMMRTEFDKEYGHTLRIQLERARENRRLNRVEDSYRASSATASDKETS